MKDSRKCLPFLLLSLVYPQFAAGAEPPTLSTLFAQEPADAWVHRIQPVNPREASVGETALTVAHRHRKLDTGLVVLETSVENRGDQARPTPEVELGHWSLQLGESQDAGYARLAYRNDSWYGSTYWTGPDWTRVGKDWQHPGQNTPSVRCFTAPLTGRIRISGRAFKAHVSPGDGVRLMIRHNARTVWQAEIDGIDQQGVEPALELDVAQGDRLRFVVHKRGEIYCDTTRWDPLIAYAGGDAFRASEGFSTKTQGENGWSYEMLGEEDAASARPRLWTLDRQLALAEVLPGTEPATILSSQSHLPVLILASGDGRQGAVIAMDGDAAWQCRAEVTADQRLDVRWSAAPAASVAAGQSLELPRLLLASYRGPLSAALARVQNVADLAAEEGSGQLRSLLDNALADAVAAGGGRSPALDLWLMLQTEWRQEDRLEESVASYTAATASHLERAAKLLTQLRTAHGQAFLAEEAAELEAARKALRVHTGDGEPALHAARRGYQKVRWLKRRIALANPLLAFDRLLFCKRVPTSYSHLVMQYYGWRARPGGGLFVLDQPGWSLRCDDLLAGQLDAGNVLEPRLSYDAQRIVFSFVRCVGQEFRPEEVTNERDDGFYHVYSVNVDGTQLRQLTDGRFDDLMPTWLPDGGIAFCSTRRQGYARCFGPQFSPRWDVYTLHRMQADGSQLRTLSYHDTNEWFPAVSNTGQILYARWDYIDRDAVTHQNLWASRPDGTAPVALWGNATSSPHCTFQAQPIPQSTKIVFTASAHHSITAGSIAVVDPAVNNDGHAAIQRITPEVAFPEAESRDIREYYAAPWPLSEDYFLVAYSPKPLVWEPGANEPDALGIYLLDALGNRELIYRDPQIGSTNPCPLVARPVPPVLPSLLPETTPPVGEMVLADVYQGLGECPRGSIKQLRIVQILPKTTPLADGPPVGAAREENARAILGTVPVEPDGSARFLVPAQKPLLFQALDENGLAYQTMRTITYVQPGEQVSCVGCHENRMTAPLPQSIQALARPASEIEPGELGGRPFSYAAVIQPVLDRHCVVCHNATKAEGEIDLSAAPRERFSQSYVALTGDVDFWGGGTNQQNAARALVPRFGGRNPVQLTPAGGLYGARGSRLIQLIRAGHYEAQLSGEELRRLAAWVDMNAVFYGAYGPQDQARELRGEVLGMPEVQ